ncbi:MAG: hypothetical protein ACREHG_00340, partial [Candidatus Saccharimonadales bacterium]
MSRPENSRLDRTLMHHLGLLLGEINPYAQAYVMMYEYIRTHPAINANIALVISGDKDKRRYNLPTREAENDVAAIIVGDLDGSDPTTEVIRHLTVVSRDDQHGAVFVKSIAPEADPMVYVLLFPFGQSGWHIDMQHIASRSTEIRKKTTMLQFYSYRLAWRNQLLSDRVFYASKLTQQYIVDAYVKTEEQRLSFIRFHQDQLRAECYQGLMDYCAAAGAVLTSAVGAQSAGTLLGRRVILPSTHAGSPRWMNEQYQDAMAIVRKFGKPDLFITMTCNPGWQEISSNVLADQRG